MKRLIAAIVLLLAVTVQQAEAACSTHTITLPDGRMLMCTTCCFGNSCNTTCF